MLTQYSRVFLRGIVTYLVYAILIAGVLFSVNNMMRNSGAEKIWRGPVMIILAWLNFPYVVLAVANKCFNRDWLCGLILLLTVLVTIGIGIEMTLGINIDSDPQSGIGFLFIPPYQLIPAGIGITGILIAGKRIPKNTHPVNDRQDCFSVGTAHPTKGIIH